MIRTLLSAGVLTLLVALSSPTPARAIPICPSGTMADYLGFGSTGCQFNSLTFSHFSYSNFGGVKLFPPFGPVVFPPPSGISVEPRSDPTNLGSGGAALHLTPFPLFPDTFWQRVNIAFDVAGPGIVRNDVSARLVTIADLQIATILMRTEPGGFLSREASFSFCQENPNCRDASSSISFPATPFQTASIFGENFHDVEAGFATPEPTTLLLFGTTAAGLGLARWRQRRRAVQA